MTALSVMDELTANFPVAAALDDSHTVVSAASLLERERMEALLDYAQQVLHTTRLHAAGSLFGKRYAVLASIALHSVSHCRRAPDFLPENVSLQLDGADMRFYFHQPDRFAYREEVDRGVWRREVLRSLIVDNMTPVFQSIADVSGLPVDTLWSHTAFTLHAGWYERSMKAARDEGVKRRISDDLDFFTNRADPRWFAVEKNPLQIRFRWIPAYWNENEKMRQREKCCFAYCMEGKPRCYTCPSIGEEERAERRKKRQMKN